MLLDFAGGTVVHISAGCAALAGAIGVETQKVTYRTQRNSSSQRSLCIDRNRFAVVRLVRFQCRFCFWRKLHLQLSAFATTNTAAAAAGLAWMFFDVVKGKKPSVLGFCIGAVVGLVAITPAAGFVGIPQSIFIGVVGAIISNIAVGIKQKSKLDDTLDVFPCHGVGGMVGMLMTGVFANQLACESVLVLKVGSMVIRHFFFTQFKAMAIVVGYSFTVSFLIFKFINFILPLRVTSEEEELGLDASQHDEKYLQGTLLVNSVRMEKLVEKTVNTNKRKRYSYHKMLNF